MLLLIWDGSSTPVFLLQLWSVPVLAKRCMLRWCGSSQLGEIPLLRNVPADACQDNLSCVNDELGLPNLNGDLG